MTIELYGMEFHSPVGCLEEEILDGSDISVDVICTYDFTKAASTDRLEDTLDCAAIYSAVRKEALIRANLLENLAGRIASALKSMEGVTAVRVSVSKIAPPLGGKAERSTVTMEL